MTKQLSIKSDGSRVVRARQLTREHLEQLFNNRITALVIPGFCPPRVCNRLARWALQKQYASYKPGSKVDPNAWLYGLGLTAGNIRNSRRDAETYFRLAVPNIQRNRAALRPFLSPIDHLRLNLDEVWPTSARLKCVEGYKYFAGISTLVLPTKGRRDGFIHTDSDFRLNAQTGEFHANCFLHLPSLGGEFFIWPVALAPWANTKHPLLSGWLKGGEARQDPEVQRFMNEALPKPHVIQPKLGDLILFNSGRPHAVGAFPRGYRLSTSTAIQYRQGAPLECYV